MLIGDKLVKAHAYVVASTYHKEIYSGHNLDLMYDTCKQVCQSGFHADNFWYLPQQIRKIIFVVEGGQAFAEYEKELQEKLRMEQAKLDTRSVDE